MKYIIPLVVPSLQEFFLANRGGDHNSQTNAMVPTAARMTLLSCCQPGGQDPKQPVLDEVFIL